LRIGGGNPIFRDILGAWGPDKSPGVAKREERRMYRHTQVGYVIIAVLCATMLFIVYATGLYGFHWAPVSVLFVLAVCLALFCTLTVEIDREFLSVRFGPGLIRKRFFLGDISDYRSVKNSWRYGWGIRLTPHGWLFNVSGLSAVEIQMKNGRKYRIGTDVPDELMRALSRSVMK
jgi:hypothetical protein